MDGAGYGAAEGSGQGRGKERRVSTQTESHNLENVIWLKIVTCSFVSCNMFPCSSAHKHAHTNN